MKKLTLLITSMLLFTTISSLLTACSCKHEWDEATCTEAKTCTLCNETEGESLGHTILNDHSIEATCTVDGLTEGSHCEICDYIDTPQKTIPATGHVVTIDPAIKPTCAENGLTEGSHCEVCNEIIVPQKDVNKLEHTEGEWTLTDEATLTDNGTETMYCSVCGDFIDSRDTDKKVPTVIGSSFNFTDDEFIDWMNDTTNSYVGYSDLSDGDMGDNTLYPIEFDGERGGIILNHGDNGKYGNVCAIMVWYDEWATSAAIAAYVGGEIDSDFSTDDAIYPLVEGDSYTKGDLTVMLIELDDDFVVATLAPSEFFAELFD